MRRTNRGMSGNVSTQCKTAPRWASAQRSCMADSCPPSISAGMWSRSRYMDAPHTVTQPKASRWYRWFSSGFSSLGSAVAAYLNSLLHSRGLSVQDIVLGCSLDRSCGYQLFNGTRRPTRDFLLKLAFLLGLPEAGSNLFSQFLQWMEKPRKKRMLIIATANRIDRLPSECKREGRFDEIFSVNIPNRRECLAIVKVHLKKYEDVLEAAEGGTGAVIDALAEASMHLAARKPKN